MLPRRALHAVLTALFLCCLPGTASAQAGFQAIDSLFRGIDSTTPGCVVALDSAGTRIWLHSYGRRHLELPGLNDSLTVFEAGSVSKQVTAAAVLLLARAGRLSLDDDVRRWIPELPALGATTVRELLTHQSGWRDWGSLVEMTRWPRGTATWTPDDILALLVRQRALNFAPGSEYAYSNTNYVLAAEIVRRASGESFGAYTHRVIFAPLGMTSTRWRDDLGVVVPLRASAWTPNDSGRFVLDMPFETVVGPGGLLTTVPDLLEWLDNLDTEQVGGPGFTAAMEQAGVLRSGRRTAYALGLELDLLDGEPMVSHAGSTGGYRAWAGRLPGRRLAVALLCNTGALDTEDMGPVILALAAGLRPSSRPSEPPALGEPVTEGSRSAMAGLYRSTRTGQPVRVRTFERGISINTWVAYLPRPDGRYETPDSSRRLRFQKNAGGHPSGFWLVTATGDSVQYDRVEDWSPSASVLNGFAGRYRSDEVGATWELRVEGNVLVVLRGPGVRDVLAPRFRDAFSVPSQGWLLTFRRNAAAQVTAVDVGTDRMRRLTFTRVSG